MRLPVRLCNYVDLYKNDGITDLGDIHSRMLLPRRDEVIKPSIGNGRTCSITKERRILGTTLADSWALSSRTCP